MNDTQWYLRLPAHLSLLALLAVTACGSGDTSAPNDGAAEEEADEQSEAETIPPEDLSGLVVFNWSQDDTFVTFHDIEDGSLNARLSLQDLKDQDEERHQTDWSQFVFSPGFREAVLETDRGLILGTLDDETSSFTPGPTVAPEEEASFSGGQITYAAPQFSPDGAQIWFEERSEHGDGDSRVLAVEVDDPEAEPEEVGQVPPFSQAPDTVEEVQVHGRALDIALPDTVHAVSEELELEVLDLVEKEPSGEEGEPGDSLEFLMGEDGGRVVPSNFVHGPGGRYIGALDPAPQDSAHTQLSLFSLDEEGEVTDDEVLLETEGNPINRYWYEAAGDRLLLQTDEAYYLHTIGDDGEPERVFEALDFGDDGDVAGESDSLGLHPPYEG